MNPENNSPNPNEQQPVTPDVQDQPAEQPIDAPAPASFEQPTTPQPPEPSPTPAPALEPAFTQSVVAGAPVVAHQSAGLAIASMVLAIIGLFTVWIFGIGLLLALVAVVLGIVSLAKHKGGKGMAIAGIAVGAVGIVAGGIFMLIALTAYSGIQERARESQQQSELMQQQRIEAADDAFSQ